MQRGLLSARERISFEDGEEAGSGERKVASGRIERSDSLLFIAQLLSQFHSETVL